MWSGGDDDPVDPRGEVAERLLVDAAVAGVESGIPGASSRCRSVKSSTLRRAAQASWPSPITAVSSGGVIRR